MTTRRGFLMTSAAFTAALAGTPLAALARTHRRPEPLKVLILGGTALIGPELVECCKARGWTITLFNRGKTRPGLFPDLEKIHGNRDPDKTSEDKQFTGLTALEGKTWDVCFDNSGYYPRHVKASAELMAKAGVKHYVYVSSISAYKDNDKPGMDETAAVGTMADPTIEEMGPGYSNYGPLKALCEQVSEAAMPGKTTVVRPGYIVGPGDSSGRFTYWPLRVQKGGEMLAPGTPMDPIQVIDVRDLAEFMCRAVERKALGTYNICGPEKELTMGEVLNVCKSETKSDATFTWVPNGFLNKQGVDIGSDLPIYLPPEGETAGFHRWSNARAVKAGLTFTPLGKTVRDLLAWHPDWFKALTPEQQERASPGIKPDREADVLAAWNKHLAGSSSPLPAGG